MTLYADDGELYYETEGEGIPCLVPAPGYWSYLTAHSRSHSGGAFNFTSSVG